MHGMVSVDNGFENIFFDFISLFLQNLLVLTK